MQHWDDLRYLLALEETGSLARAAKELKTNPTTVSRHIKRLSETYKKTLVTRSAGGEWTLTKDGQMFALAARRCNSEISALTAETTVARSEVTITTTEFVGEHVLTPHISNVISAPSEISLTLDMRDRNLSLAFGEADLAIRLGRPKTGNLVVSKLGDLQMGVFSLNGHTTKRWVGLPAKFDWVPEMQLGLKYFQCEPAVRIGSFASIREIAVRHNLACIGPTFMMSDWQGLEPIKGARAYTKREAWSVYHETRRHDAALRYARDWVKGCFENLDQSLYA